VGPDARRASGRVTTEHLPDKSNFARARPGQHRYDQGIRRRAPDPSQPTLAHLPRSVSERAERPSASGAAALPQARPPSGPWGRERAPQGPGGAGELLSVHRGSQFYLRAQAFHADLAPLLRGPGPDALRRLLARRWPHEGNGATSTFLVVYFAPETTSSGRCSASSRLVNLAEWPRAPPRHDPRGRAPPKALFATSDPTRALPPGAARAN